MFNKQAAVSFGYRITSRRRVILDLIKKLAASQLNDFKDIPGKACLNALITMTICEHWKLAYEKNNTYEIIMQENRISFVIRNFPVYELHN